MDLQRGRDSLQGLQGLCQVSTIVLGERVIFTCGRRPAGLLMTPVVVVGVVVGGITFLLKVIDAIKRRGRGSHPIPKS